MADFDALMNEHQVAWRKRNIATLEQGTQNGLQRERILPSALWQEGLWPSLRGTEPGSVQHYLDDKQVQRHTGSHNLKSSWISGVNTYFPFGQSDEGRQLLASFLAAKIDSRILKVDSVELEYAEDGSLSPLELLGEDGGSRGSGQTSPDIAFIVNKGRGLVLVENKLTEHSFYPCSARTSSGSLERPANPDVARCKDAVAVLSDPTQQCHQETWGRKYWYLLHDVVDTDKLSGLSCCPASRRATSSSGSRL